MSAQAPSDTRQLRPVYLAVFLDMVAFAVILPVLPFYAMELGANGLWLGVLLTAYSGAKLLGAPFAGRLSDTFGRKPLLLLCLFGSGVSFVLTGLSGSLLFLAVARGFAGLFGGTVATAQAYIADVTRPADRARYMGLLGAAIGSGFIIGPGLGAALSRYGFTTATSVAAVLALLNTVAAMFLVSESPRLRHAEVPRGRWLDVRARPVAVAALIATFLTVFAFVSMETTLAFVARDDYGLNERGFGMILVYVGVVMIVIQGGVVGRLVPRLGERKVSAIGAFLLGGSMFLLPFVPSFATAMIVLGLLAVGQGLASPTLPALLSHSTSADRQGGMLGLAQSVSSAARAIAPVSAGWLFDHSASWPFVVAGVLALLAALTVARVAGARVLQTQT